MNTANSSDVMACCCVDLLICSTQVTALEPLVNAARGVLGILILVGTSPHLVPEMQGIRFRRNRRRLWIDQPKPLEWANRAKDGGWLREASQSLSSDDFGEEPRTEFAPANRAPILRVANLQRESHRGAADWSFDQAGADNDLRGTPVATLNRFRGEDMLVGQVQRSQA